MQNEEEKLTDNSEASKEKRYQDAMNRMRTKKIVSVCVILAAVFAALNIMMSQGTFDFIFLGGDRAEEQKRQEMMKVLESSLSASLAASASAMEEETEKEDSIYAKIHNKMKQSIPCFYVTEKADNIDGWIMANGIMKISDFENDMSVGIVFRNQVQEVSKVHVNLEEDEKVELKNGKEIATQINIQADNLIGVEPGCVAAPMENIHKAKNIVLYAYFFDTCEDVPQGGATVGLDIAGTFVKVSLGDIKSDTQSDVDEIVKGQTYFIFTAFDDEIYIVDNSTVTIYNMTGDAIGKAIIYEEE